MSGGKSFPSNCPSPSTCTIASGPSVKPARYAARAVGPWPRLTGDLIEVGVFNLLYLVFGWDVAWAKVAASLVALINAYFGNREWTFRDRGRHGRCLLYTSPSPRDGLL